MSSQPAVAPRRPSSGGAAEKTVEICSVTPEWHARWDEFVLAHPLGTPFHLTAWMQSISATFAYKPHYVLVTEGEEISAVLPLFLVDVPFRAKALISTPFAVYGGVLAKSEAVKAAVTEHVLQLGKALGVAYVELRNIDERQLLGFTRLSRYVTFTTAIGSDEEAILNSIPRKTRAVVRKSLKAEFCTRRQNTDITAFEELYSANLRRLGTPSFPKAHFRNLIRFFGNSVEIREVSHNGELASAVFSLLFRDQVLPYYGAADPRFNALGASSFMYFDQMRSAGAEGYQLFDFGRSKKEGSGSYDFKAHWGMLERELPYEIALIEGKELPNYSPVNPKFRAFIWAWQRLPLWMTRMVGPAFVRLFP